MNHLGVFAKYWQPGRVKTRLAASIGMDKAAELYRIFVEQTLNRFKNCGDQRSVWIAPPERRDEFQLFEAMQWTVELQTGGDLGNRMADYFESCFQRAAKKVILIGTDSPSLSTSIMETAFVAMENHDCVIGPSKDGGYYLIGMKCRHPELFQEINWSTDQVLPQTINRLQATQTSWYRLPEWNDVDNFDDLQQLRTELKLAVGFKAKNPLDEQLLDAIEQALNTN